MAGDLTLDFPKLDFSYIGNLPKVAQDYQEKQALQTALADLKPNASPSELRRWADKAIALGTGSGIEAGVRLHNIAQQQENEAGRRLTQTAYLAYLNSLHGASPGMSPGQEPAPPTTIDFSTPAPAPAPAVAPAPTVPAVPGMPAVPDAAVLPPGVGIVPGPRTENIPPSLNAPLSPTEQVLQRAQSGQEPAAPLTQLAGQPPTPDTAPPQMAPQEPVPFTLPGKQLSVVPGTQSPLRIVPAPAAAQSPVTTTAPNAPLGTSDVYKQAETEARSLKEQIDKLPPGGDRQPIGRRLLSQWQAAMSRLKLPESEIAYHQELMRTQLDNKLRAEQNLDPLPEPTRTDFKLIGSGDVLKETMKNYDKYQTGAETARTLGEKLNTMKDIIDDPEFAVGEPGKIARARAWLVSWVQTMKANNIPIPISDKTLNDATRPTALKEAFKSLANQSVTAALGGLSKSISDSDRKFLESAYPSLLQTKTGVALIHNFLTRMAERMKMEASVADDYMHTQGVARATPWGMNQAVRRTLNNGNDILAGRSGELTQLGQQMEAEMAAIKQQTAPAGPTAPPGRGTLTFPAAAEGKRVIDTATNKTYTIRKGLPVEE